MDHKENKSDGREAVDQVTDVLSSCPRLWLVGKISDLRYGLWSRKSKLQHRSPAIASGPVDPKLGWVCVRNWERFQSEPLAQFHEP